MSNPLLDRAKLDELYPPFAAKVVLLSDRCTARGALYVFGHGLRTFEEQDALYAIGRTTGEPGHVVTDVQGGHSSHNYGLAEDAMYATQITPTVQIDDRQRNYEILAEEATALGLVSGLRKDLTGGNSSEPKEHGFIDPNHVAWPIKQMGFDWDVLIGAFQIGGLPAVWALLDKWQEEHGAI